MAKNGVFNNLQSKMTNKSYLLDLSVLAAMDTAEGEDPAAAAETKADINLLVPFENHPFHVDTEDDNFLQLVDSIKENGIIEPILVRPRGERYEIISGHRRVEAGKRAGLKEVPIVCRSFDDYEATIIMVHSNFYRDKILISEKAKAYRMCMDAEKHQGKKGADTAALIGNEQDSKRQVYRYIRLSYLLDSLLSYLDDGKMPMNVGLELAYLDEEEQNHLLKAMEEYSIIPSVDQAKSLRAKHNDAGDSLTYSDVVTELVSVLKKKPSANISFKRKDLQEYFDDNEVNSPEYMTDVIKLLLEEYRDDKLNDVMKAEWNRMVKEYEENPTEELRSKINTVKQMIG